MPVVNASSKHFIILWYEGQNDGSLNNIIRLGAAKRDD